PQSAIQNWFGCGQRPRYEESLRILRELGNKRSIAQSLHQLGIISRDQGDYASARRQYEESLRIRRKLGNKRSIVSTLHQLGMLAENEGDLKEAAAYFSEALQMFEELGAPETAIAKKDLKRVQSAL
ncbi:MAG: tetratricopeptide repeat protein, partial [bacterium]|nr:tetratricopeptide repeat protein [bacterium]